MQADGVHVAPGALQGIVGAQILRARERIQPLDGADAKLCGVSEVQAVGDALFVDRENFRRAPAR